MTETGRYDVSSLIEAQYQKGSRGRVLRNLLGISGKRVMDEAEAREQKRALRKYYPFTVYAIVLSPWISAGCTRYGSV
jgi:cell filamentation protein